MDRPSNSSFSPSSDRSLGEAFLANGVALTDPQTSWSGLRCTDGTIFIAFREDDVRDAPEGFRCLLWSPGVVPFETSSRAAKRERFFHCQMAAGRGQAIAFVARGTLNEIEDPAALLHVDVVLQGGEYWATWGWSGYGDQPARAMMTAAAPVPLRRPARMPLRAFAHA